MPNEQDAGKGPEIYRPQPPDWLPKAHISGDLGQDNVGIYFHSTYLTTK
jgi:hypothetical protein